MFATKLASASGPVQLAGSNGSSPAHRERESEMGHGDSKTRRGRAVLSLLGPRCFEQKPEAGFCSMGRISDSTCKLIAPLPASPRFAGRTTIEMADRPRIPEARLPFCEGFALRESRTSTRHQIGIEKRPLR